MNPKIRDLMAALAEWLDREPWSLAVTLAGLACGIALVVLVVTGG